MNIFGRKFRRKDLVLFFLGTSMIMLGIVLDVKGYHNYNSSMNGLGASVAMVGCFLCAIATVAHDRARLVQSTDGGERPVSTAVRRSNRMVRTIGIALVLVGVALFAAGSFTHNWTLCIYGLLAAFLGVLFVRGLLLSHAFTGHGR